MRLMIVEPRRRSSTARAPALRQVLGLTILEAANAAKLARGRGIEEIAAMRRVGTGSLRAQFRAIAATSGKRRQSELVALILRYSRPPKQGLG